MPRPYLPCGVLPRTLLLSPLCSLLLSAPVAAQPATTPELVPLPALPDLEATADAPSIDARDTSPADSSVESGLRLDAEILALADSAEVIEVWGERAKKPFDRDTELRLTGVELARRGVTDLAQALEYIPEINVRNIARGGRQIDVRGARKSSVKVLVDGVPIGDPYRGNVDLSSIPVTDIVELRVSTSPASPIDGTGGSGGVIEVHTRDAIGRRMVGVRADVNSLSQALVSVSGRSMLSERWAVRVSATGDRGGRDLAVVMPEGDFQELDENRRRTKGALRLEYRAGDRRLAVDANVGSEGYVVPPSETESTGVVVVDDATGVRLGVVADDATESWRFQLRAYGSAGRRLSSFYRDARLDELTTSEDNFATTLGGAFLVNRPLMNGALQLIGSAALDSEGAEVEGGSMPLSERATIGEVATGFKLERGMLRADGAAGVAVPVDIDAAPWPEAKLSVKLSPLDALTTRVVAGHKGRLPTLRERFEPGQGNESLGPEKALYAELGATVHRNRYLEVDVAGYWRRVNGLIRYERDLMQLVNLGELSIRGVDARVTVAPYAPVRVGGSVSLLDVKAEDGGDDLINRLPERRADLWVSAQWNGRAGGIARVRYIGEQPHQAVMLPDYWLVDLSAHMRASDSLLLGLRIDNALDDRYLELSNGTTGLGRVFLLSAQGTWE